ncbi:MAG: hypothetical protein ACOCW2_00515 [Chitinivibrionales bacterium]
MALAHCEYESSCPEGIRCRFDIGVNRYYACAVGDKEYRLPSGLRILKDPEYITPLHGPLHESALGRGLITVDRKHFNRKKMLIQLTSYRKADRTGPALSAVIRIPVGAVRQTPLAVQSFSKEKEMRQTIEPDPVDIVPMRYREIPYSQSMFLQALVGMLPQIVPAVGNILGGLIGGGSGRRTGDSGGSGGDLLSRLTNPEVIRRITQMISQISNSSSGRQPSSAEQQTTARSIRLSEAKMAPALLAALPALMPLLRNVLSPETVRSVIDAPNRHLNTVINGMRDFARLGLESHEQDLRHLRELNPGVDDPALDRLLASLSVAATHAPREMTFIRAKSVSISFVKNSSPELFGKLRPLYVQGTRMGFPIEVRTPRTIGKAILELVVKDPDSLAIIHYKKAKLTQVQQGALDDVPAFDPRETMQLVAGKEYLVCVALIWKNSRGKSVGTSRQQKIAVVNQYSFDRVEEAGELIPLRDVSLFRPYWHKVWQGSFKDELKRFEFNCKYYTVLRKRNLKHAKIETRIKILQREPKKVVALLKAGMEYSPEQLNKLIPCLIPGASMLSEPELMALHSSDFSERFNQAARYVAKLRGRSGDSGSLWVYPEVKMQTIVLQKTETVDENGLVVGLTEHRVSFPIPVLIHFIGARTQ